jgi:hypothetical protein
LRVRYSQVPGDGLAVDPQFVGDSALGPAASVKCTDCLSDGHLEQIRHRCAPEARNSPRERNWRSWVSSKWLVFKRPALAGFERPLTIDIHERIIRAGMTDRERVDKVSLAGLHVVAVVGLDERGRAVVHRFCP